MSLQKIQSSFPTTNNPIRTALITARSTPSHKQVIHTMRKYGIRINESFFLSGLEKGIFLKEFSTDIFFEYQYQHCQSTSKYVPTGDVPNSISSQKIMLDK